MKVLLALLPFWTPQVPPLGISCLKSTLKRRGFGVKTLDINIEEEFNDIYNRYFSVLEAYIPGDRAGNFFNTGNDLLRNHLMAHLHTREETASESGYIELVKLLVDTTFFSRVDRDQALSLNRVIADFYHRLERRLRRLLEKEKPEVLGISVYSGTLPASLFAFKWAKEAYPRLQTVMGGGIFADQLDSRSPNFDPFLEKTPYIDKIIIGEGEILFRQLLEDKLPGSKRVYTLADIDGETLDLPGADIPDFSDFDLHRYPYLVSYASRSCPFQCAFCSETLQWGKYREKGAPQVVQELRQLYEKHGRQLFLLGDSLLNPLVTRLAEAFLQADVVLYWDGYLRADKPVGDMENTLLWRRGGFYRARLGLESGSPSVLERMGKKITPPQIRDAVGSLGQVGIKTTTYWVVGYPGETEVDFRQTLDLVEELKNDIYEAECNPFHYFPTGQVKSDEWARENPPRSLYPPGAAKWLMTQTWVKDGEPSREEVYSRVRRFAEHCRRLEIPNPYSLHEIYQADERWKRIHKNAVPALLEFENRWTKIDECRHSERLFRFRGIPKEEGDWAF